jgi:hypothetical protein
LETPLAGAIGYSSDYLGDLNAQVRIATCWVDEFESWIEIMR